MKAWNSTFNTSTTPMKRSVFRSIGKPMARTVAPAPKKKRARRIRSVKPRIFRSSAYLALVRQLPCARCGRHHKWTQAAHSNQLRFGKGQRIKASDATAMPLCAGQGKGFVGCHENHDQGGKRPKAEWWDLEYQWICQTVQMFVLEGNLTGAPEVILMVLKPMVGTREDSAVFFVHLIETGALKVAN